jgi:hypothetical protein
LCLATKGKRAFCQVLDWVETECEGVIIFGGELFREGVKTRGLSTFLGREDALPEGELKGMHFQHQHQQPRCSVLARAMMQHLRVKTDILL